MILTNVALEMRLFMNMSIQTTSWIILENEKGLLFVSFTEVF